MATTNDFEFKQRKYMPIFPKASGKPTVYIEGYPCEDDEPMAATGFHAEQIRIFSDQISRYFAISAHIYIQPEMEKPPKFRGWRRSPNGGIRVVFNC